MNIFSKKTDLTNFEKLVLGFLLICVTIVGMIKYLMSGDVSSNWVYIIGGIASIFTARKAFSYFKPVSYNADSSSLTSSSTTNTETPISSTTSTIETTAING